MSEEDIKELIDKNNLLSKKLKQFEGLDITEAKNAIEFVKKTKRQQEIDRGEFEKTLANIKSEHNAQMSNLKSFATNQLLENELGRAIAAKGGDSDILVSYLKDKGLVSVNEKEGLPTLEATFNGKTVTVDELVSTLASNDKYDRYFKAIGQSGSGAKTSTTQKSQSTHPYADAFNIPS